MFLTPGSRPTRKRISPTGGSTVAAALGPFTPLQTIYANSSNTITGMSGTTWTDATSALSITPVSTANTFSITVSSATAFQLATGSNNAPITFLTNGAERARVAPNGFISAPNAGGLAPNGFFDGGGTTPNIQAISNDFQTGFGLARFGSGGSPKIHFGVSRGAIPTQTILQSSDGMGLILFEGSDGSFFQEGAFIQASVDAAPSSSPASMPGRIAFGTTPTGSVTPVERMRIDSAGYVSIGSSNVVFTNLQVLGSNFDGSAASIGRWTAAANGPNIQLIKSRSSAVGGHVIVSSDDQLGVINFLGDDGAINRVGAGISAQVDGTPGASVMPGRFLINTTPAGTASLVERVRVDNAGNVIISEGGSPAHGSANSTPITQILGASVNTEFFVARYNTGTGTAPRISLGKSLSSAVGTNVAVSSDAILGEFNYEGVNTGLNYSQGASIQGWCDGPPAATTIPGRIVFNTGTTAGPIERVRIDSSGHVIISDGGAVVGNTDRLQVHTATFGIVGISHYGYGNNAFFGRPRIDLAKSRGTTVSSNVIVQQNDVLGTIRYTGADGTSYITGVTIDSLVDGTPGTSNMPSRLAFNTTSSGTSATERMRIDSGGSVWLFATTPSTVLVPTGATGNVNETVALYNHQGMGGL